MEAQEKNVRQKLGVKIGTISYFNAAKGFGMISTRNSDGSVDRFYFLYTRIKSGKEPEYGDEVRFVTKPEKVKPGMYPNAYDIHIAPSETPTKTNQEGGRAGAQ